MGEYRWAGSGWMAEDGEERPFIHRLAVVGEGAEHRDHWHKGTFDVQVGPGASIGAFCGVDRGIFRHTQIGARTKLLKQVRVGHDTQIGEDCEIAADVGIGGESTIGNRVKIGMGAQIRPRTRIADDVVIGMGTIVLDDITEGVWVGNPARRIR